MKPVVDKSKCISCGLCAQTVPEVFMMGDDGFAEVIKQDNEGNLTNFSQYESGISEAIGGCPTQAIFDEEGEDAEKDEPIVEDDVEEIE